MSKIKWETNTAVNILAVMPIIRVTANPLIGPVPNWKRKIAAIIVVTFASRIVLKAREKPAAIELKIPLPEESSSLILSKTKTLASTAIPIVNMIPAIPR
jgi:hypothetical protein